MMADENVDHEAIRNRLRQLTEERRNFTTVWAEHKSDSGEIYYYNSEDQSSTWEKPDDLKTPAELILSDISWKEYNTQEGKTYYHNPSTGETRWEPPASLLEIKSIVDDFLKTLESLSKGTELDSQRIADRQSEELSDDEATANSETNVKSLSSSPMSQTEPVRAKSFAAVAPVKAASIEQAERTFDVFSVKDINAIDKKDAGEAFRKFLDEKNVPSNINWENCVKIIQSDKRFDVWKRFSDRKQNFNVYKIQKQKQEKEDQRKRLEKARENFDKMLSTTDRITFSTSYRDAEKIFAADKIWRGVPERERENLYHDVMVVIEKRDREQAEKDRTESMEKLADILFNINQITYRTTWFECQRLLAECHAFINDPVVKKISKLDALTVFKEHIFKLEKEHKEDVKTEKRQRIRTHRKYREAYLTLLDELTRQGIVHSMAKWKTSFPVIRNDPRFLNMQEQTGSNALDLFKLYVKDLQNRFLEDSEKITSILKAHNFVIGPHTEFPDYYRLIHKDEQFSAIDRGNIKLAFDTLKNQAIQEDKGKQEERQKEEDRKMRQQEIYEDNFFQMLKDSKVSFDEDSKWLAVQERFSSKPAYQAIRDEEARIRLFHQYLSKLSSAKKFEASPEKSPKKKKKSRNEERERSPKHSTLKRPTSPHDSKSSSKRDSRKRHTSPQEEPRSSSSRSKKKKRHHRSSSRDGKNGNKDKKVEEEVALDPATLASVMTDAELERQREQLMRELGLMDD